jgi:hypothetical protein
LSDDAAIISIYACSPSSTRFIAPQPSSTSGRTIDARSAGKSGPGDRRHQSIRVVELAPSAIGEAERADGEAGMAMSAAHSV